ncbi:MAG: nitrate/nitrite transporter [Candidatus Hodarchaeota archaeon]
MTSVISKPSVNIQLQLLSFMSIAHFIHHVQLYAFPAMIILISQEISLSYLQIGILGSLPIFVMAVTSPLVGYLGKSVRTGFSIVISGILLFALSSFMIAISNDYTYLLMGNIVLGLGCTTFHPIGLGVSANSFSGQNRGKAMAVNHAAGVIGTATSPFVTLGLAVFIFGWRHTFWLLGIGCFFILILMIFWLILQKLVPNYLTIMDIEKEITKINNNTPRSDLGKWIIITLGVLLTISAFRGGVYRLISFFTVTLLRDFYNVGSFEAGVLTSFILLLGSGSDVYGAYISDKSGAYGRVKIIIVSAVGTSVAILGLMFLTVNFSEIWAIVLGFSLFAISFYLAGGTLQALMSDIVPQEKRTFFYSIVFSLGLVVSSTAPTIFGALLDLFRSPVGGFAFILVLISGSFVMALIFQRRIDFAIKHDLINP